MTFNGSSALSSTRKLAVFCLYISLGCVATAHGRQDVQLTLEPSDESVAVGLSITLHCELRVLDPSLEQSRIQIRWRGDDPTSFFDFRDSRRSILSNGSLHITRVTMQDQGSYQCVADIDSVGQLASRVAHLVVVDQITFADKQSQDLRVFLGQTAHFSCRPHGSLQFKILWVKNEKPLVLDPARMMIMPSGALEIDQVVLEDQGSYRCNASSGNLYKLSNKAILTINTDEDAAASHVMPIFITRPKSATVKEGEMVTLDCAANGNPRPWLVWLKDGVAINMSDTRFEKLGTGTLQIKMIREQDVGNYQCRAGNQEDSVDASALIQVHVPPRYLQTPQDTISTEKKDLELSCQVYGKPEPKIQWLKNGEIIRMNDYLQLSNGNNLKILGLMEMDAGIFQCIASNAAGNVQTSARLTVLRIDDPPSDAAPRITESFDGDSDNALELPKRTRNKPRQFLTSADLGGNRDDGPTSLVPGPPKDVRAAIVSKRFVTLSWSRPDDTNGELVAYSVFYRLEGSQRERVVNTTETSQEGSKSQITVQGLQPDRLYHFRVVAHNTLGPGESSGDLEISTGAEANVPSSPTDLTVVATSPTSLNIEWKPPASTTDDVLKYRLFYMEEDSAEESHIYTSKTSYELSNLKKFTEYTIWVMAINSNGPGSSSDEITVRTLSDVPSDIPMNITVEAASSTSIIVRWEPPPKEGQNGVITGYKLRYKKQKGRGFVVTAAGDRRLYAISDLDKGSMYQVRLAAMNVNGTGPPSEWHSIETYENDLDESQVPSTPKFVTARHSSNTITVTWGPPEDSKTMVRGYVIGWGIGIPDEYTKVLDAKQRHFIIQDLELNCEYVIAVRGYNDMGDGAPVYVTTWTKEEPASETQAPLIPPIGLKAIVLSSTTVVLYWSDMPMTKSSGAPEDRYYTVKYTSPHYPSNPKTHFLNVTEMNCMITDLRPNTLYEFSVKYTKGRRESKWSMVVHNTTQEAPPSSPPRDLTVVAVDGHPDQITLNWQPPKQSNGLITGYMILYTTDENLRESDWVPKDISGDRMTTVIKGLQPSTTYYLKLQAKNSKGYGPVSNKISFTTQTGPSTYDANLFGKDGNRLTSVMTLIIACCCLIAGVCILIIVIVVCCKRAKSRRQNDSYLKGNTKIKTAVKPPDLWIHHDQMELKNLEKSHHSNSDIGPSSSGSQMNTLVRASSSHPSEFEHTASLDKRTYLPSYVGSDCSNQEKTSTIKRSHRSKPISLTVESQPVTQPVASAMPSPACDLNKAVYPRTMYRSHLTMDGGGGGGSGSDSTYAMQAGYDSIASMQHSVTLPAAYPVATAVNGPNGNQLCSAAMVPPGQIDGASGTLTKRQMSHPLKSFSVPAPPPQSAPSTPQQKHVVRPQPGSSPYKKPPHSIICAGSPGNSKLRSGPGTAEETARLQPSYSTEELNQEMANLEGLMKDLNAITASEFEC